VAASFYRAVMNITPDPVKPGQESVWSYPRPAVCEPCIHSLVIMHDGVTVASTRLGMRTLETSHPPSYYFPREDIAMDLLRPSSRRSVCEWKGQASYFHVTIGGTTFQDVGWCYTAPTDAFARLKDHIAFYAGPFDLCSVAGERVTPQSGGFYGGWVTSHVAGPFKGAPGTKFW
jgi:uncharacterized protein (DUF427 family)